MRHLLTSVRLIPTRPSSSRRSWRALPRPITPARVRCDRPWNVTLADCDIAKLAMAIDDANTAGAGPHVITLKAGCTYSAMTINNYWYGPTALPAIASDITIDGTQQGAIIERNTGAPDMRLFFVAGATLPPNQAGKLALKNVTLRNGQAKGRQQCHGQVDRRRRHGAGGAVYVNGELSLMGVTVTSNTARGGGSSGDTDTAGATRAAAAWATPARGRRRRLPQRDQQRQGGGRSRHRGGKAGVAAVPAPRQVKTAATPA